METAWARRVLDLCEARKSPYFGKQRAGFRTELPLLVKNGKEVQQMPKNLPTPKGAKAAGKDSKIEGFAEGY
jgi:protein gp37